MGPRPGGWWPASSRSTERHRLAARDQAAEDPAVLEAVARGQLGRVLLDPLPDGGALRHVEAGDLALVPHERRDLALDAGGDVHDDVRLVRAPVPELAHLVRLEPVPGDVLGEVQVVARVGVHRVGGDDARLPVVAALEPLPPLRILYAPRV